jgi:hypothetical protein
MMMAIQPEDVLLKIQVKLAGPRHWPQLRPLPGPGRGSGSPGPAQAAAGGSGWQETGHAGQGAAAGAPERTGG